uniref:Uncharacterized protein n=1 Tax=Crocodylus porosus TaxID=8502 RepID=A0A7M4F0J7_CROPO
HGAWGHTEGTQLGLHKHTHLEPSSWAECPPLWVQVPRDGISPWAGWGNAGLSGGWPHWGSFIPALVPGGVLSQGGGQLPQVASHLHPPRPRPRPPQWPVRESLQRGGKGSGRVQDP